jgi:ribose transport system substrate-binding protein
MKFNAGSIGGDSRRWSTILVAAVLAVPLSLLTACGAGSSATSTGDKLLVLAMPFPCGLNEGTAAMCAGAKQAEPNLPKGYKLDIVTGVDFGDVQAFNNLLQTTLQRHPAGLIVFPNGPAAQTPILNRACDQGVKIVIMDSPAEGIKCQGSLVGADHHELGAIVGKWMVQHPPATKEVGIVTQPKGQFASTDARIAGFEEAVKNAGYTVAAEVTTDMSLDKTRSQVTNMLTAHPKISAIFSGNGPMGQGTMQALASRKDIEQLTLDFDTTNVEPLKSGVLSAVGNQNPVEQGKLAVETLVKLVQGQKVEKHVTTDLSVVDQANVDTVSAEFKAAIGK